MLLDVGLAQGKLEGGELVAMHADAAREEVTGWNRKHAAASVLDRSGRFAGACDLSMAGRYGA